MRRMWEGRVAALPIVTLVMFTSCRGGSTETAGDSGGPLDGASDGGALPDGRPGGSASDATTDLPTIEGGMDAEASQARTVDAAAEAVAPLDAALDTGEDAEASCVVDAGELDDAEVQLGQSLVISHGCPSCHGETLSGNPDGVYSPQVQGGTAYPPNLTSDPETGLGCWTNAQIENAFLNGINNQGMTLCPPMPRFGHLPDGGLNAAQAQAVVEYLRSLPIFSEQVPNNPNCTVPEAGEAGPPADAGADAT
jgi:hypothetical protein